MQSLSFFYTLAYFCCLCPLSFNLLSNLSQLPWNSSFVEEMRKWAKHVQMACFVLKTQGVPIYDLYNTADRIFSCRAWVLVYLTVFYKRQYLKNISLY